MKTELPETKWKCLAHGYIRSSKIGDDCPDCYENDIKHEEYCRHNAVPGNWYKHYKGGEYQVIRRAKLESTGETMVVYEGATGVW